MFGGLDYPDEGYFSRGDGAGGVAGEEGADEGELMGYSDAAGEEHDGAVGGEGVGAAVGAFDEGGEGEPGVGCGGAFGIKAVGEAGATADYEGEGGLGEGEDVGIYVGFFEVVGGGELGEGFGPGEGEGVGGVEADGGDGEEDVLAWVEGPGVGEVDVYAEGVAGKEFDICTGGGGTKVAVEEDQETLDALKGG